MGWASGSELMIEVINGLIEKDVNDDVRKAVYEVLVPAMEGHDWDTQSEPMDIDPVYDATIRTLHPNWFQD